MLDEDNAQSLEKTTPMKQGSISEDEVDNNETN